VLRLTPAWTRWAYWLLVAALAAGIAYGVFGTVHEYASGPAVVWMRGRLEVNSRVSGTVATIEVRPGQTVAAGAVLARFHSAPETAELVRLQRELEQELVKTLRDPGDAVARQALTALVAQKDLAAARVDELVVRAPEAGVVGDVRIRAGQRISAGEVLVTLVSSETRLSILAMLPAHYRPQLRTGMSLRFEVGGYRYAYQEMVVESVSAQIIGPGEVKRYLGQEIADTVHVEGPVVLVEARPASPRFEVDQQTLDFYHGMNGTAEARVRSESLFVALVPSLRVVTDAVR
jgi:multidrug efflux pump subunit AcrA (membrane-fusion protein)